MVCSESRKHTFALTFRLPCQMQPFIQLPHGVLLVLVERLLMCASCGLSSVDARP